MMLQPGWYRTTGDDLVCLKTWPSGSGGQVHCGRIVNVGLFYGNDEGKISRQEDESGAGLDLDRASWRPFQAVLDGKVCEMHRHPLRAMCPAGQIGFRPGYHQE